jgi:glycosyltransferase involved in cell wall biosynthesis
MQLYTMREALRLANLAILTISPRKNTWLLPNHPNALFIPVGANLPSAEPFSQQRKTNESDARTICVFSVSGGSAGAQEVDEIVSAMRYAAEQIKTSLRLVVFGRNVESAERQLQERLRDSAVELTVHGVLPAEEIVRILSSSDVLLFVRGPISTRRGSAISGIACGLPVIARAGFETDAPITEAGVVLLPPDATNEFGPALVRILTDSAYRSSMAERSRKAQERYFSWSAIAEQYVKALTRESPVSQIEQRHS